MYSYGELKSIHLELTDKCNAACPQCVRNDHGGADKPDLPLVELSLADIKSIFPTDFLRRISLIYVCGNFGDAAMARDTLEIFTYLRSANSETRLGLHTNGSVRTPSWWTELGKILGGGNGYVRFGIDGLEDTNHLYRRRTNWKAIMRNAEAFIKAGGSAIWDFIVFKHNEHQVARAKETAMAMGFLMFSPRKTGRFFAPGFTEPIDRSPVKNASGAVEYYIEPPSQSKWINDAWLTADAVGRKHGSIRNYLDTTPISCEAAEKKSIYVSAEGLLLPCCHLGARLYGRSPEHDRVRALIEKNGGKNSLNAKLRPIKEIVEGDFFQTYIPQNWERRSREEGRALTCAIVCGKELRAARNQYAYGAGERALKALASFCRRRGILSESTIGAIQSRWFRRPR